MPEHPKKSGESPPGRTPEPSVLFSCWPERDRPLAEEVRLALDAAFPGVSLADDLEASEEILWGTVYRLPVTGQEVLLWAEARGELSPEYLAAELGPGPEFEAAIQSPWLLGCEMVLDGRHPVESFQRQLQVIAAATVPGVVAVYDDNALVVHSGRRILDLARCSVAPRASALYAIHTVDGNGGCWVHTHGLGRAGIPEIDVLGIPDQDVGDVFDLVDVVVDALLGGIWPDADGRLALGEDLSVRALELDAGLGLFPADVAGGRKDREEAQGEHSGPRLVIVDEQRDGPVLDALARVSRSGIVYKPRGEGERQRRLSVDRWGTFGQLFVLHRHRDWRFHVKLAFERGSCPGGREHLWFEVLELKPDIIRGRLVSRPVDVAGLVPGAESWVPLSQLTDWVIITPEGPYDPEAAPVLLGD